MCSTRATGAMAITMLLALLVFSAMAAFPGSVAAQFTVPSLVTPDSSGYHSVDVAVDMADNISFVMVLSGDLYYANTFSGLGTVAATTASGGVTGDPRMVPGAAGSVHIAYEENDEVLILNNPGGIFEPPVPMTADADDDVRPALVANGSDLDVAWEDRPPAVDPQIFISRNAGVLLFVAEGSSPAVAVDAGGNTLVGYERDDAIHARLFDGASLGAEFVLVDEPGTDGFLALATDDDEAIHGVFVNGGTLCYFNNEGGSFSAPQIIDAGPVAGAPRIAATGSGEVSVVYGFGSEIRLQQRIAGTFGNALDVAPAANDPMEPSVVYDSLDFTHIAFEDGGAIYYTTNVPEPQAFFTGGPLNGVLPVTTDFVNTSVGVIDSYFWDFGDGTTSTSSNPSHTFTTPGTFNVSLTVTGPGGSDTHTKTNYINTQLPDDYVLIPSIRVFSGEPSVKHPVKATHVDALQGFQVVVQFDYSVTPITDITLEGTVTGALSPEFFLPIINVNGADSSAVVVVILDVLEPFDGRTISPGTLQNFINLQYDVPLGLSLGTFGPINFVNGFGDPPIFNIFSADVDGGVTVLPFLLHGGALVDSLPTVLFRRGDFESDGSIQLGDAISELLFLFSGGPPPACYDAADLDDDGATSLGDAIHLLNFLFVGGAPPAYPYPGIGLDPTPDNLPECF